MDTLSTTPDPKPAPTPQQILALPMQENDARAETVRDYLLELLTQVWRDGECFDGKRPFGNSSWEFELYTPLVRAGFIAGAFEVYDGEETGGLDECDHVVGDALIEAAIRALGRPDEQTAAEQDGEFRLGHGGAWCTACHRAMREGTPVAKVPAVVCKPCAADLAETGGRLDPGRLNARDAKCAL